MNRNRSTKMAHRVSLYLIAFTALTCFAPRILASESCTHIQIELNGNIIPNPTTITLIGSRGGKPVIVPVKDGCFRLPKKLVKETPIEVKFQINGENIDLIAIEEFRFDTAWTIELSDTASDELLKELQATNAKEICTVDFDPSDGDGMAMTQAGCRTPVTSAKVLPPKK
jgi:hypothetical protein